MGTAARRLVRWPDGQGGSWAGDWGKSNPFEPTSVPVRDPCVRRDSAVADAWHAYGVVSSVGYSCPDSLFDCPMARDALGQGIGASPIPSNPRVSLFETFSVHCDSAAGDAGHAYGGESWVGHSRFDGLPVCPVTRKTLRERMGATPIPLNPRVFLSGTLVHAATWRSPLRRRLRYSGRGRPLLRAALQGGITFHSVSARRTWPSPWGWLYVV